MRFAASRRAVRDLAGRLALAALLAPATTRADPGVFRPLLADPRESAIHLQVSSFTQDFRYGADVTDSTSRGGWERGVSGVTFDVGGGKTFRLPAWDRMFGWAGPWRRYQLTASALMSSNFDRISNRFVTATDYQFGGGLEAQWTGPGDDLRGATDFRAPVVTSRTQLLHRSSHLGDELIGQANFGRNQTGPGAGTGLAAYPPIKRTVISHEVLQHQMSVEWAPGPGRRATLRAYAGGEWMAEISTRKPRHLRSPAYQLGAEWRSLGNVPSPAPDPTTGWLRRALGRDAIGGGWFAAVDLRLARPFNFASCDNPDGETEVWTPSLWTPCDCGREFRHYAGTWQGMAGLSLFSPRTRRGDGGLTSPETLLALEWSRGYSWHGPFLDSPRRTHPRWYVVPSLITHF